MKRKTIRSRFYHCREYREALQRAYYRVYSILKRVKRIGVQQLYELIKQALREEGLEGNHYQVRYVIGFFRKNKILVLEDAGVLVLKE